MTLTPTLTQPAVTTHGRLAAALKVTRLALPARPPIPILACVLIRSGPTGLDLTATDYELSIRTAVHPDSTGPEFTVAVLAADLHEVLTKLAKGSPMTSAQVTLTPADGALLLHCEGYEYRLATSAAEDYPVTDALFAATRNALHVNAKDLREAIARVEPAVSRNPVADGSLSCFELTQRGRTRATLAGSDRFRLHLAPFPAKVHDTSFAALLPGRALAALVKALPDGDILIQRKAPHVSFRVGPVTAVLACPATDYRSWTRLLPTTFRTTVTMATPQLLTALRRITTGKVLVTLTAAVDLTADPWDPPVLTVQLATSVGLSSATSPLLPADGTGESVTTAFNPAFLAQALAGFGEQVTIGLNGPRGAVTLAASPEALLDPDEPRVLLMPAKLPT